MNDSSPIARSKCDMRDADSVSVGQDAATLGRVATSNELRFQRYVRTAVDDSMFRVTARQSLGQMLVKIRDLRAAQAWSFSLVFRFGVGRAVVRHRVQAIVATRMLGHDPSGWARSSRPDS